jgi:hypothetical protein
VLGPDDLIGSGGGPLEQSDPRIGLNNPGRISDAERPPARRVVNMGPSVSAPLSGHLSELAAAELIRRIADTHGTGMLRVGRANPTWIAFSGGAVVTAGVIGGRDIRSCVVSSGAVSAELVAEATRNGTTNDLASLSAMVDAFGADTLRPAVRENLIEVMFQLLLPSSEPFIFAESAAELVHSQLTFDAAEILLAAESRARQWTVIAETVTSVDLVFRPRRHLVADMGTITLTPREWEVLSVLDGRRTVAQVIAAVGRSPFDVCSALHAMLSAALLERIG